VFFTLHCPPRGSTVTADALNFVYRLCCRATVDDINSSERSLAPGLHHREKKFQGAFSAVDLCTSAVTIHSLIGLANFSHTSWRITIMIIKSAPRTRSPRCSRLRLQPEHKASFFDRLRNVCVEHQSAEDLTSLNSSHLFHGRHSLFPLALDDDSAPFSMASPVHRLRRLGAPPNSMPKIKMIRRLPTHSTDRQLMVRKRAFHR